MTSTAKLREIKQRGGPLQFLDLTRYDLVEAHRQLGMDVKTQVHRWLKNRLDHLESPVFSGMMRQVRDCGNSMIARSKLPGLPHAIRAMLEQYLACLTAWAQGCELKAFDHRLLAEIRSESLVISPFDLALFLQYDSTGCQTGMYRQGSNAVLLWHTEEDLEPDGQERFDRLRLASFRLPVAGSQVTASTFIYPDVLPGSTFGWHGNGYFQAVDTLLVKPYQATTTAMLANVASWVAFFLGPEMTLEEVISSLQPFIDGYAINVIYPQKDRIIAARSMFAADRQVYRRLPEEVGSLLFQVNVLGNEDRPPFAHLERHTPDKRRLYELRLRRTERAFAYASSRQPAEDIDLEFCLKLLSSRAGGEWAYANKDVRAYCLARLTPAYLDIWLGAGPAIRGEIPIRFSLPISL